MRTLFALAAMLLLPLGCDPVKVGNLQEPGPNAVSVSITSDPPGADVTVDGTPLGAAPRSIRLNPGPHVIKAAKSGYFSQEQRVVVRSGEAPQLVFTLVASH